MSDRTHALLTQHPLRAIVALAVPTTGVMFMAAVVNAAQTYFISRLGDEAIAALSLVFPIALVLFTVLSNGLGTGASSAIARALGAGRMGDARELAEHAFAITAAVSAVGTLASEIACTALFHSMGGRGVVLEQAVLMGRVLFGGLLITMLVGTLDSILRAGGYVRIAALGAALSMTLQVALTPLLMFSAGLGLVGAPVAMLSGQLVGLIPRGLCLFGGYFPFRPRLRPRRLSAQHVANILRVATPAALAGGLGYVGLMILTGTVARYGDAYLAAYGLGTRFDFLVFSLGFGVATAALTLVGIATGAGRPDLLGRYVLQSSLLAVAVSAAPALLIIWRPALWLGMFTDSSEIHRVGASYFRLVGPSYAFACVSMVIASAFQGLGRASVPMAVVAIRVTFMVALALTASHYFGLGANAIFAIIAAGYVGTCIIIATLFRKTLRSQS